MAPLLRRPGTYPALNLTQGGKAGNKDPRNTVSGNNPFAQPDIQQFAREKQGFALRPPVPYVNAPAAPPDITARTTPTRVQFVQWHVQTLAGFKPVLWVPRNQNRLALVLGNENAVTIHYTYGIPALDTAGQPIGYLLSAGISWVPPVLTPIDDVYVFATSAVDCIAYEGFEVAGQQ